MQQTIYTRLKVNNEIELCETSDLDMKQKIEKVLLHHRISYYVKWVKPGFFTTKRNVCIFCVNDNFRDESETAIKALGKDVDSKVKFIMRKVSKDYL